MVTNVKGRWDFFLTYHPVFFHRFPLQEKAIKKEKDEKNFISITNNRVR